MRARLRSGCSRERASIPPPTEDEIARGVAHAVMVSVCGMGG